MQFQSLKIYAPPVLEPVTTKEAKAHLRVDGSDEDTLIDGIVSAAREHLEDVALRAFLTQTYDLRLEEWPCDGVIKLPRPPLQSVTSIVYTLEDGSTATLSSSAYVVDSDSEPGRILLKSGYSWPSDTLQVGASIRVRYVAGWTAAASVPKAIRQALLLLAGHWYENREAMIDTRGNLVALPFAVDALITPHRIWI